MGIEFENQYSSVKLKNIGLDERLTFRIKGDKPHEKEVPGGVSSRTGKAYNAFTTYGWLVDVPYKKESSRDDPQEWYFNYTSFRITEQLSKFSEGDWVSVGKKFIDGKGLFVVDKATDEDFARILKETIPGITKEISDEDLKDTLADPELGIVGANLEQVKAAL